MDFIKQTLKAFVGSISAGLLVYLTPELIQQVSDYVSGEAGQLVVAAAGIVVTWLGVYVTKNKPVDTPVQAKPFK